MRSTTSGIIYSNKNGQYTNGMKCDWSLSGNTNLELVFFRFDTEENYDFVYVYAGSSSSSPLIASYNGSYLPANLKSSSYNLFVEFSTDMSVTNSGFAAGYHGKGKIYEEVSKDSNAMCNIHLC